MAAVTADVQGDRIDAAAAMAGRPDVCDVARRPGAAPRVHTVSVGCKVSRADAEGAERSLHAAGYESADGVHDADLAVILTCCVTAEAERKSRRLARRLSAAGLPVVVSGCAAVYRPEQFAAPRVAAVPRDRLCAAAAGLVAPPTPSAQAAAPARTAACGRPGVADGRADTSRRRSRAPGRRPGARTRLTLKVQDGCTGECSYCAVRLARGPLWSLPIEEALRAARDGLADGCGEVVLSGINLGLYQDAGGATLADLVIALTALPDLGRLRLSSIEPLHLRGRLLQALSHPRVARHLHVPLQSADDTVLADMRRPYDLAEYLARLDEAEAAMGPIMVSTDLIVGFPSEDEAAFDRSLRLVEAGRFGRVHVFPYSPRPGTEAAALPTLAPQEVARRRAAALAAATAARAAAAQTEVGTVAHVLVEDRADGYPRGYTSRYTRCYVRGEAATGTLVAVSVQEPFKDGVRGVLQ